MIENVFTEEQYLPLGPDFAYACYKQYPKTGVLHEFKSTGQSCLALP